MDKETKRGHECSGLRHLGHKAELAVPDGSQATKLD